MTISSLLKNGTKIGFKNLLPLLGTFILYILTIWVPYINVGTTIAIYTLPAAMSRGQVISPTQIFDSKYRKHMGNFFLLLGFLLTGVAIGLLFGIIPGIILSLAWSLAILLLIDQGLNPMQALHQSNLKTYGKKLTIFYTLFLLAIIYFFADLTLQMIIGGVNIDALTWMVEYGDFVDLINFFAFYKSGGISWLLSIIMLMLYCCIQLGIQAEIYKTLVLDGEEKTTE